VKDWILVTCEHGGNRVPRRYAPLFRGLERQLRTHRGFDFGALLMAREISRHFTALLVASTVTRMLVDLNRSISNRRLYSAASRAAPKEEADRILRDHYFPYRRRVEGLVAKAIGRGRRVVHISSHSFTPRLHGRVRRADVGLLYDPARRGESDLCALWKTALENVATELTVRRNSPYAGKNDGLTTHLRLRHRPSEYVGIELEINQRLLVGGARRWAPLRAAIVESLRLALARSAPVDRHDC
jgi:predicted N-formylglutamate amidohydrolase